VTTGYEPLNTLKPFGPDIWIVDGPSIRFYGLPFPTRMTVVRLPDGTVWLHSPIALDEALWQEIETIGPIRHIVAPNWIHYASVWQWQDLGEGIEVWAAPGVAERAERHDVPIRVDHVLEAGAMPDWGAFDARLVSGSDVHREAVFHHRASRVLILTDLIENFEPEHLPWWMAGLVRMAGIVAPDGRTPPDMAWTFRKHRAEVRRHVEWMLDLAPEKVIVAHGACYENDATARLRKGLRRLSG
jgi:hypothetical protein